MRQAARPDSNQTQTVQYLRDLGFAVQVIRQPADLLLALGAITIVSEVKNPAMPPSKRHLTDAELTFYLGWPGLYVVLTGIYECAGMRTAAKTGGVEIDRWCRLGMRQYFQTCYTPEERTKQAKIHGKAWVARMKELGVE